MTMCDNFTWQDDEIQNQARLINQLKEQLGEQEDALKATQVDSEKLQSQISSMQSESETSKTEVKEVLQALEELAVNYDQKLQEVETKTKENEKLSDEVSQKQVWRSSDFLSFFFLNFIYSVAYFLLYRSKESLHISSRFLRIVVASLENHWIVKYGMYYSPNPSCVSTISAQQFVAKSMGPKLSTICIDLA